MITGEDRDLFARSLDHAVSSTDVDGALAGLGWTEALAEDEATAVSLLFERQGAVRATSGALSALLAHHLGVPDPATVVLPPLGGTDVLEPGAVDGLVIGDAAALALPVAGGCLLASVGDLSVAPVDGLDPRLGLRRITGSLTGDVVATDGWPSALAAGQRALGHELVGASRTMLELARTHALERVQFDQPIAAFQAVRHKLADCLVAIETAASALDAAWFDGTPLTAAAAKATAGRGAQLVAKHSQQVLAGIGFTREHDFHRYYRRVLVLDRLLGDSRSLTKAIGEHILAERTLPPMQPL